MNEPIRILHVIGIMNRGGAEAMIMNLYREIDRSKVQFDFVENTQQTAAYDDEIRSLGGRIFNCPHYRGLNHLEYVRWWDRFFREHAGEFNAVHGHLGSTACLYLSAAKKYGLYTIAHSHNTNGAGLRNKLYRAYAFPTRYIADFFFGCSLDAGRDRFGKKVASDASRFRVLNNAIDTRHFAFDPVARTLTREKLRVAEDELLIGHVGRFVEQKNHPFLIDIFSEMVKIDPKVKLLLIGHEDPEKKIRAKVESLGLTDRVIFAGVQEKVSPFYQAMDLFLMPSLFEGLPLVLVEAQTSGVPCVISDKIPEDSILIPDLVSVCKLSDDASTWAKTAWKHIHDHRRDRSNEIAVCGFDIRKTAEWLTDFYMERADQE